MKLYIVVLCSFALLASRVTAFDGLEDWGLSGFDLGEDDLNLINSFMYGSGDYEDNNETTTIATEVEDHDDDEEDGHDDGNDEEGHDEEDGDHDEGEEGHDHAGHDHGSDDPFEIILEILDSSEMNRDTFSKLLETLLIKTQCDELAKKECSECTDVANFFNAVGSTGGVMSEDEFNNAAFILVHYMYTGTHTLCNGGTFATLEQAKKTIFPRKYMCRNTLDDIADGISNNGCTEIKNCYKAGNIMDQEDASICLTDTEELGEAMTRLVLSVLECSCVLPKVNVFMEDVMGYMGISESGIIPIRGFAKLVDTLGLGKMVEGEEEEDSHDDHSGHNHRRRREIEDAHEEMKKLTQCYSDRQLAKISGAGTIGMTRDNFMTVCPVLIQQIYSESCIENHEDEDDNTTTVISEYTNAQKYGYATASVTIISFLAFIGLLVFPAIGSKGYKLTMQFFIALGVGSLSGDAILHIIPEILGIHKHEPGDNHDHSAEEEDKTYVWKLLTVVGGIYIFYFFENSIRLWNKLSKIQLSLHVHENGGEGHQQGRRLSHYITELPMKDMHTDSNGIDTNEKCPAMITIPAPPSTTLTIPVPPSKTDSHSLDAVSIGNGNGSIAGDRVQYNTKREHKHTEKREKDAIVCGMTSVGVMVLIGDILHNFGDGLAIGVAFSSSWMSGIGTSIAIFCHELPHEFGDFAIYLNNGLNKWQALLANFIAACFAYIGCYIGLAAATDEAARSWMMAVIAGMFLYIALVDVLHEMLEEDCGHPVLQFVLQNIGLLFGWALLLLIAYFEDSIINVAQ